jgi:hypothetical protein
MIVDGVEVALDTVPLIKDKRLFIPARSVAEAFGIYVGWDPQHKAVHLSSSIAEFHPYELPGDNVFIVDDLSKVSNSDYFMPAGGSFLLNDPESNLYFFKLNEDFVVGLNKRVFDTSKILFDEDLYNSVKYIRERGIVQVGLSSSKEHYARGEFNVLFELPELAPFQTVISGQIVESLLKVTIGRLNHNDGNYKGRVWSAPELELRVKDALTYLFGRITGPVVYKDLYAKYMESHFYPDQEITFKKVYEDGLSMHLVKEDGKLVAYFNN